MTVEHVMTIRCAAEGCAVTHVETGLLHLRDVARIPALPFNWNMVNDQAYCPLHLVTVADAIVVDMVVHPTRESAEDFSTSRLYNGGSVARPFPRSPRRKELT